MVHNISFHSSLAYPALGVPWPESMVKALLIFCYYNVWNYWSPLDGKSRFHVEILHFS